MSPEQKTVLQNNIATSPYEEIPEDRAVKLLEQGNEDDPNVAVNRSLMAGLQDPEVGSKTSLDSSVAREAIAQEAAKTIAAAVKIGETATHEDWPQERLDTVQNQFK